MSKNKMQLFLLFFSLLVFNLNYQAFSMISNAVPKKNNDIELRKDLKDLRSKLGTILGYDGGTIGIGKLVGHEISLSKLFPLYYESFDLKKQDWSSPLVNGKDIRDNIRKTLNKCDSNTPMNSEDYNNLEMLRVAISHPFGITNPDKKSSEKFISIMQQDQTILDSFDRINRSLQDKCHLKSKDKAPSEASFFSIKNNVIKRGHDFLKLVLDKDDSYNDISEYINKNGFLLKQTNLKESLEKMPLKDPMPSITCSDKSEKKDCLDEQREKMMEAIISIMWALAEEANNQIGAEMDNGSFSIIDKNWRLYQFLENYLIIATGYASQNEFENSISPSGLGFIVKSSSLLYDSKFPYGSLRTSSHYKNKRIDCNGYQLGINATFQASEYAKAYLPDQKRHILFGKVKTNTDKQKLFLKFEQYGLNTAMDMMGHTCTYFISQNESKARENSRREKDLPLDIALWVSEKLLPDLQTHQDHMEKNPNLSNQDKEFIQLLTKNSPQFEKNKNKRKNGLVDQSGIEVSQIYELLNHLKTSNLPSLDPQILPPTLKDDKAQYQTGNEVLIDFSSK